MDHLDILRYALVAYVVAAPYLVIYIQQSQFRSSFDDEISNRLVLRVHVVSTIAVVGIFVATFDWGRVILK